MNFSIRTRGLRNFLKRFSYGNVSQEECTPILVETCAQSETIQSSCSTCTKDDVTPTKKKHCVGIKTFTLFSCIITALIGLHGQYFFGSIRMLEKQFGFKSSESGLLRGVDALSGLIMVIVLGYCGDVFSKPKMIGWCTVLSGTCSCLMALPHFVIVDDITRYNVTTNSSSSREDIMCKFTFQNSSSCNKTQGEKSDIAFWILFLVRFVYGIGATSYGNLIMAYIHENAPSKQASFLICITTLFAIIVQNVFFRVFLLYVNHIIIFTALTTVWLYASPITGLSLSGYFNSIPVDLKDTNLTPDDPRFIGAWWMGFLIIGIFTLVFSLPVFFFPKHLTDSSPDQLVSERRKSQCFMDLLKDFYRGFLFLMTSPLFVNYTIAILFEVLAMMGHASTLLRYIETQYRIPIYEANYISGILLTVSGVLGGIASGAIMGMWEMSKLTMTKFMMAMVVVVTFALGIAMLFGCPQVVYAGSKYNPQGPNKLSLQTNCSDYCHCDVSASEPVCGSDGQNYFTPCHAGCTDKYRYGEISNFSHCECVAGGSASPGTCAVDCTFIIPYIVTSVIVAFASALLRVPVIILTLRILPKDLHSYGLGVSSFVTNAFAFLPGEAMYGLLVDSTCLIWQEKCGERGSCLLYDTDRFRYVTHSTEIALSGVTLVAGAVGWRLLKLNKYAVDPPSSYKDVESHSVNTEEHLSCSNDETEPLQTTI